MIRPSPMRAQHVVRPEPAPVGLGGERAWPCIDGGNRQGHPSRTGRGDHGATLAVLTQPAKPIDESPGCSTTLLMRRYVNHRVPLGLLLTFALAGEAAVSTAIARADSRPSDTGPASPAVIGLVPGAAHVRSGPGRLPISGPVTIILRPDATGTAGYAAECLRGELNRLFGLEAIIAREPGNPRTDGVAVFVEDQTPQSSPDAVARFPDLPAPTEDGYLLGVFPEKRASLICGFGGNGVIRGVFALAGLTVAEGSGAAWPEGCISDSPDLRIRLTRDILASNRSSGTMTREQALTCELDWWARWGLNYALMPSGLAKDGQEPARLVRWFVGEAHRRGMKAGVNLGGRSLCPSDPVEMDRYLSRARHLLDLGCDFFLVLFDDLPRDRLGGHCDRCIRDFGASLAAEQCHILESLDDVLQGAGSGGQLIWCPTYYSLGMTGYIGAAEGPDKYFTILGRSTRVRHTCMCHCAFDRQFCAYLDSKGLTNRIWWYNGIRTDYYMVSRAFDGYDMWGPPLRIPGLKDFRSFFSPFENGWLMPSFTSANTSLHPCVAPLVTAGRDERGRTVIPPSSWEELAHLPGCVQGLYLCSASTPYHIALAGIFAAHPALFDQERAQGAIADAVFSRGASRHVLAWQAAYARAQMLLARGRGRPLAAEITALTDKMGVSEKALRDCVAHGKPALPAPLPAALLDEMNAWRLKLLSLASSHLPTRPP
jgi:hypothetical protein